ncbi:MAG: UPF0280 family protein [Candidatus Lokiarchaeota archaeon]|nr:UPF0280 family protein [Candidatus Lokiarchaeota archaeon]
MDGLISCKYTVAESRGIILCETQDVFDAAIVQIKRARADIEAFVARFPEFRLTFEPWSWEARHDVPRVVQRMIDATTPFGIGPMAAVAGAIIDEVYDCIGGERVGDFIMENGGEILVRAHRPVTIGLHAGKARVGSRVGFVIPPGDLALSGIASSSATIGHAISFGNADIVTVFCGNASVADAAATAFCNMATESDAAESVRQVTEGIRRFPAVTGIFAARGDSVGMAGRLPGMITLAGNGKDMLDLVVH